MDIIFENFNSISAAETYKRIIEFKKNMFVPATFFFIKFNLKINFSFKIFIMTTINNNNNNNNENNIM